ncbi:MAG TPA: DUF1318 domain-containing protein [Tepidisphaeraceae bacterium]|nr:DUF1318 domain-containing protein [Tepidisphaeraceae bacterium]
MTINRAGILICAGMLTLVLGFANIASAARADTKAELQARFKQRLAQVNGLKREGKVGETWDGWLETVKKAELTEKQQKLIDAENDDRKELYKIIAEEEKTSADVVGQRNAQRNYKLGKKGDWFKLKNGVWKQKERE